MSENNKNRLTFENNLYIGLKNHLVIDKKMVEKINSSDGIIVTECEKYYRFFAVFPEEIVDEETIIDICKKFCDQHDSIMVHPKEVFTWLEKNDYKIIKTESIKTKPVEAIFLKKSFEDY